jgi:hypothetical protein
MQRFGEHSARLGTSIEISAGTGVFKS